MYLPGTMDINEKGHLTIGGCDTVELAHQYGTPLYVMDEMLIRQNCRNWQEALAEYPNSLPVYAGKAFLTMAMVRLILEEDMGLDVVSGGELYIALKAGFPAHRIIFHGNNKTPEEVEMALTAGVGRLMVDNFHELFLINMTAARLGVTADVILRVKPGIEAHTHEYIKTGQEDSKFGFGLAGGQIFEAIKRLETMDHVNFRGLHCHIGSQIFSVEPYLHAVDVMMDLIRKIRAQFGIVVEDLDLGGGFGIRYTDEDCPLPPKAFLGPVIARLQAKAKEFLLPLPRLMIEPGRSIVGEAGVTLYTIGAIKQIPGVRTYLSVDGGMSDNPRHALYGAKYEAVIANRANDRGGEFVTVAGKYCESGDILIRDLPLVRPKAGEILAVFGTGAYNYSMASHYNSATRPAVLFVRDGVADVVVERETYEDLLRHDRIPERLQNRRVIPLVVNRHRR